MTNQLIVKDMQSQINDYFKVQRIVKEFKDAKFFTTNHYKTIVEKILFFSAGATNIILYFSAIAQLSNKLLIWSFAVAISMFLLTRFGNDLIITRLITRTIASIIWDAKIDEKVSKIKSDSRDELYLLRETIELMVNADRAWRIVAEDALAIREYRMI